MNRKILFAVLSSYGMATALFPVVAHADFIIEFMDSRTVTVGRYSEEGQTIKIYNALGAISFLKADIKRIIEVQAKQSKNPRLETVTVRPPRAGSSSSEEMEKVTIEETGNNSTGATTKSSPQAEEKKGPTVAEIEAMENRFQEVKRSFNNAWQAHTRRVADGAPPEELQESRRRLRTLDEERSELIKNARKADQKDWPIWAQ